MSPKKLYLAAYGSAFSEAVERTRSLNGELVEVDFGPFCEIAMLLYNSAFVAERYAGIRAFVDAKVGPLFPRMVTSEVFSGDTGRGTRAGSTSNQISPHRSEAITGVLLLRAPSKSNPLAMLDL